jgi:group I intron endonuclease
MKFLINKFKINEMKSNKELRNEYKQKKYKIGVFQIRNTINEKVFIGSSVNLDAIWNRNKGELKFGGHRNKELQQDWSAYGEENFKFEILSEIVQEDGGKADYNKEVKKLEEMFIEELQPFAGKGYNTLKA